MKKCRATVRGFALPTVMIASVVMVSILLSGLTAVSSINVALYGQYNEMVLKEAADSGVAMAQACLDKNNLVATWTDLNPLKPNTDCNGNEITGAPAYVISTSTTKTWFEVPAPIVTAGIQSITVKAELTLHKLGDPNGTPYRTHEIEKNYNAVVPLSFKNIGFGYSGAGAHFGVAMPTGEAKMVGYNGDGRLGDGTTTSRATPVNFELPVGQTATRIFSNFLSIGYNTFVITSSGDAYAAGDNRHGMLGAGSTATQLNSPAKVALPAGVQAKYVSPGHGAVFVIGSNYNIYSAGMCQYGFLGSNYTITGCTDRPNANARVALPAVNLSDPNTLPVTDTDWVQSTNIANDLHTVLVRMQGGRVYSWGMNHYGQLGRGDLVHSSVPAQVGTFGNTGQPKATQVAFDGETGYILDDTGSVYASVRACFKVA